MGDIWWETEGGREEAARVFPLSPLSLEWQPQQRLCLPTAPAPNQWGH